MSAQQQQPGSLDSEPITPSSVSGNVLKESVRKPVDGRTTDESKVTDTTEDKKEADPKATIGQLFAYADGLDKALMIIGSIAALVAGAGMPGFSQLFGDMIAKLTSPTFVDLEAEMARLAMYMVFVGLGVWACCTTYVACWMIAAERQTARIREEFFAALMRQEAAFHDENKPGGLAARLTADTKVIKVGINDKIGLGLMNVGMFICGFSLGFYRGWELTLLMVGTLPLLAGAGAVASVLLSQMSNQSRDGFAKAAEVSEEALSNYKVVQIFGAEDREVERFEAELSGAAQAAIKKEIVSMSGVGFIYLIMFGSYGLAFWFSSYLIEWGRSTVGEILTVFFAVLMGSFGIGLAMPAMSALADAQGAAHKVLAVINRESKIDPNRGGKVIPEFRGRIEFRDLTFSYPTRQETKLFSGLNLAVEAGSSVAFSGASGCGKSSLVALAQRLYDPDQGQVLVDGVDLRDLDLRWWRSMVGVVSQEPNLFSGSIMDNILVGNAHATQQQVEEACRQANIHETIMSLPDGYHTEVGTVGSQLSGGQKQRLAIARAIVKDPKLLILDEATSALDRKSEVEVQAALDRLLKGGEHRRTVLVIAHRLATIRDVDVIHYVTHDGAHGSRVAESGTFGDLVTKGGHFAHMVSAQSKSGLGKLLPDSVEEADDEVEEKVLSALTPAAGKDKASFERDPLAARAKAEDDAATIPALRLIKMTLPQFWAILLGFLGSVISGGLYPAYSVIFSKMLNVLSKDVATIRDKAPFYSILFGVIAVGAFCGWLLQSGYGFAGAFLTRKLRRLLLRNVLRQDATFFDMPGRDPGSIGKVLSGDCESVYMLYGPSLGYKVQMLCNLATGLTLGLIHQWKVALVTLAGFPLVALGGFVEQRLMMGFNKTEDSPEDTIVTESLTNIRTVMAFNQDRPRLARYTAAVSASRRSAIIRGVIAGVAYGSTQFCVYGVFALAFWYGGTLVAKGEAVFEDIMIASMSVLMAAMGVGEAGGFAEKASSAQAAAKRVFALVDRVPDIDAEAEGDKELGTGASLTFDGVHFAYPARPKARVLRRFDNALPSLTSTGLIGTTGCGKSTIVQLLARHYDPALGAIKVNGKDLRAVDLATWRAAISIVPQEPSLFSGTVADNIRYSRPGATDEEVEAVARLAAVHDEIVEMPDGYATEIGYKGQRLSGGQKQRVAIARGLLRRPRLLLLDEATSALDNVTEAKVQAGIAEACRAHPMSVVAVAHRLTTIQHSDKIVLLENGVVLEEGNHDSLMEMDGEYKNRFDMFAAGCK